MLLEELVQSWLASKIKSAIEIVGGSGSGKTTAIAHLAAIVAPGKAVLYFDEPGPAEVLDNKAVQPVVFSSDRPRPGLADISFPISGWGDDELIEYLQAAHSDRCGSVMKRLLRDPRRAELRGAPELWRPVLERMAGDETAQNPRAVLRTLLHEHLPDPDRMRPARMWALGQLRGSPTIDDATLAKHLGADHPALRLLRHHLVQILLAAELLCWSLDAGERSRFLWDLPRELVRETARSVRESPVAMRELQAMLDDPVRECQSVAASILHATGVGWRPTGSTMPLLTCAFLEAAEWPGIDLSGAKLNGADLTGADLSDGWLVGTAARGASLRGARLDRADLTALDATQANLVHASARNCSARRANFREAKLAGADFSESLLQDAKFDRADLKSALFCGANLQNANLRGARIDDADFSGADLSYAMLYGLALHKARFVGAKFREACLSHCDMEDMRLPQAEFNGANLTNALLTGSRLRGVNFQGACMRGAGLADVDWPSADLRGADLRESSFFLGSSRSGLVGSPLACEGSRTGFYTDDFDEQAFKAPEEIRKANLRGADLRGANVEGVDFYLVDLRDAKYTEQQADQFRSCRAILFARAAN